MGGLTCRKVLVDGPVVHLKSSVAPVSCESYHMVFAIVHWDAVFLHKDINCANVECDTNFALFLGKERETSHAICYGIDHS